MSTEIVCYRCGASLAALTLPLSRRDMCPSCSAHVHVCRLCINYDPQVIGQCLEDDAEEVLEKERVNFCDWFKPRAGAFDPAQHARQARAESELASLFGDSDTDGPEPGAALSRAEDLFK